MEMFMDMNSGNSMTQIEKNLERLGIKVLRFTNTEISESINEVLELILSNHPLTPSLSKEGGIRKT
jgi:very-short-patch-repair endonuclease